MSGDSNLWGGCNYDNRAVTVALFNWLFGGAATPPPPGGGLVAAAHYQPPLEQPPSAVGSATEPTESEEQGRIFLPLINN
jgi:hypothetical protein